MSNETYQSEGISQLKELYVYCINLLANLSANNVYARKEILSANGMEVFGESLDYFSGDPEFFDSALWFMEMILQKYNSMYHTQRTPNILGFIRRMLYKEGNSNLEETALGMIVDISDVSQTRGSE